jgi:hypothetical protein
VTRAHDTTLFQSRPPRRVKTMVSGTDLAGQDIVPYGLSGQEGNAGRAGSRSGRQRCLPSAALQAVCDPAATLNVIVLDRNWAPGPVTRPDRFEQVEARNARIGCPADVMEPVDAD